MSLNSFQLQIPDQINFKSIHIKPKSLFLSQNTEISAANKLTAESQVESPLLPRSQRLELPVKPDTYLRNRKGKAGILLEIEEKEREELLLIRQKVLSMNNELLVERHINEKFTCGCSICMDAVGASLSNTIIDPDSAVHKLSSPDILSVQDMERDFCFVMKKLIPPKHVQRSLRLFVPETVTFNGGEAKFIVMTGKDRILRFVRQKDKLTLSELRKLLNHRRRRRDENVFYAADDLDSTILTKNVSTFSDQMSRDETQQQMNRSNEPMKQNADNIYSKEVALIKFKDDSTQMLGEMELMHFLLKRKVDKFWHEIQYIQKFSRSKKGVLHIVHANFVYERDKDDPLYARAKPEILFLNGDLPRASDDFIPLNEEERFEEELKTASAKRYCKYLLYKMVHFLEIISSVHVEIMVGEFMRDNYGLFWVINLSKVQYKLLQTVVLMGDSQLRFVEKLLVHEGSATNLKNENPEKNEAVKAIDDVMQKHYENLVRKIGVEQIANIEHEDTLSDQVFAKIYPGANVKLSQMIKGNRDYSEIQEYVSKNESVLRANKPAVKSNKQLNRSDIVHNASDISFENGAARKNSISNQEISRPSSVIAHRRLRSATPVEGILQNPSISKVSQGQQRPANVYFRAVRYQNGRRDEWSDNQRQYIGERAVDMPEISMYYNQSELELNQEVARSRNRVIESKRSSVAYTGTSKVIAKHAFPGIPIPSEQKQLESTYTRGLRIPMKKRLKQNFHQNLPKNRLLITNLSVLLEDPIVAKLKK